ncbi:hypothetical protein, partial [Kaarinaea lacus]
MAAVKFINFPSASQSVNTPSKQALWWYFGSALVLGIGFIFAARYYPAGFDWVYTVVSALASQKHNP